MLQMDKISAENRSKNMSAIRGTSTKPELIVRKFLTSSGVKYRCNVKTLPGSPDIAIQKYKLALNVHGCFWHGHKNCENFRLPKSNTMFWDAKIGGNVERDFRNRQALEALGFQYFVVWECELKAKNFEVLNQFIDTYFILRDTD